MGADEEEGRMDGDSLVGSGGKKDCVGPAELEGDIFSATKNNANEVPINVGFKMFARIELSLFFSRVSFSQEAHVLRSRSTM